MLWMPETAERFIKDIKKLKGHSDLLRLRVGEYRIIYTVDNGELIIYVVDAGNRGEIYKKYILIYCGYVWENTELSIQ